MATDAELRRRLQQEIGRMSESERSNRAKSEQSFFAWLAETLQNITGKIVDGAQAFFDWLFGAISGRR